MEHITINQSHVRVQQLGEPFSEHQQVRGGRVPEDNLVSELLGRAEGQQDFSALEKAQ